jgi:hypothetical protein
MSDQSWRIEGEYFESCNCELLCPCLLSQARARPTEGHCDVVLATHISEGNYGNIGISGLNVIQALTTPAEMSKGNGTLALYLDDRADDTQRAALEAIFSGNAGGPPSLMNAMIAHRLPSKPAHIIYASNGRKFAVSIPGVTDVTVEGVTGARGEVVWLENVSHPFSQRLAAANGTQSHFRDHSLSFDNSGRNGHFSAIKWSNP